MTELLVRQLPGRARALASRLEGVLDSQEDPKLRRLAASVRLGEPGEPYRIVATGQYSAGKSTILRALTGDDSILTGADVTTTGVAEYRWGDVLLVDTPGVQAGLPEHDDRAEQSLRVADLVLFVVTVDLFDELGARHLRHVAIELGKARDMIVVVNKSGTLRADPSIRLGAVQQALGDGRTVPQVVICDALDFLDALAEADAELRVESGFDALPESMNRLVRDSGRHARLRRPFDMLRAVVSDALQLLADDPAEQTAWSLLSRQRRALLATRDRVDTVAAARSGDFRSALRGLADSFADALDAAEAGGTRGSAFEAVREDAAQHLEGSVRLLCTRFAGDVEADIRALLSRAGDELQEISAGPQAEWLRAREQTGLPPAASAGLGAGPVATAPDSPRMTRAADAVGTWATRFARFWGGDASSVVEMSGTAGHRIVLVAGARLGVKFKPWQAVRIATTVQTVARATAAVAAAASAATPVLLDIAAARAERSRHRRRAEIHRSLEGVGAVVVDDLSRQVAAQVAPVFDEALAALSAAEDEVRLARKRRSAAGAELDAVDAECVAALRELEEVRPASR
ncbi:MAG: GTPase [Frankiaceae bacterium]